MSTIDSFSEKFFSLESIPREFQLPAVVVTGLIGFVLVISLSKWPTRVLMENPEKVTEKEVAKRGTSENLDSPTSVVHGDSVSSPSNITSKRNNKQDATPDHVQSTPSVTPRSKYRTPTTRGKGLGSVETPKGRRSARLAKKE